MNLPLPQKLRPRIPLTKPIGKVLNFKMEEQVCSRWCWAATAVSVRRHFRNDTKMTKCLVAGKVLGRDDCCEPGLCRNRLSVAHNSCNVVKELSVALHTLDHLRKKRKGPATFGEIAVEIDDGLPLCAAVKFDKNAHFFTIVGYNSSNGNIYVANPSDGSRSVIPFSRFPLSGKWVYSYWTKK